MTHPLDVWHNMWIWDNGENVIVEEATNDDEDRGYPTEYAHWTSKFDNLEQALKHTGKSRTGIGGVKVTVFLNGKMI